MSVPGHSTTRIQIDASAHCQLSCPSCPTASGATRPAMGAGHLDPGNFGALLESNPDLAEVELSNYGEMFLNPRLQEILRLGHERNVVLHADNGVNMNNAREETLEALVRYRFRSMTVSLDGASADSYTRYRIGGDFDRVIGNIRTINNYKRQFSTVFPLLSWQFIVFGHNEHEIAAARRMAGELGMTFRPKISWDDEISPVRNNDLVRIRTGLWPTREEHFRATGTSYLRSICHQVWHSPVLNWDGRVMGCCRNFWGDFGANAFRDGLANSLETPKLVYARQMLTGRAEPAAEVPCSTCDLYTDMQRDGNWITDRELKQGGAQPGVTTGVVIETGASEATHADVFIAPGPLNRLMLASPPPAHRYQIGDPQTIAFVLAPEREYTLYVLPKRLDPAFRIHYPPLPPVTHSFALAPRPLIAEFTIRLNGAEGM